jgi:hypothetical protein
VKKTAKKKKVHATSAKAFPARPTRTEALAEVKRFFALLKKGDVDGAGAAVEHASKDWWPHQVRSLWQDLVGPWLEERGEDWDVDDDKSWRDLGWLSKLGVDLDTDWDGKSDRFYVNVEYDGEVTDVSAEFSIAKTPRGWVLRREIIHME